MSEKKKDEPVAAVDAAAEGEQIVPEVKVEKKVKKPCGPLDEEDYTEENAIMEAEIARVLKERDVSKPVDMSPDDANDWLKCDTDERKLTMKERLLREE